MKIIERRLIWYAISLVVLIPGLISLFMNGLNTGIDFKGGHALEFEFAQQVEVGQVRDVLDEFGLGQGSYIQATEDGSIIVRTKDIPENELEKVKNALTNKLGKYQLISESKVGPAIGKELTRNALYALAIAAIMMVIYITFRFELLFGIAAVLALLHDVFVVVGIFSLFQWEIDSAFVAAILTIIGYSINDTIVIFDRIRENLKASKNGNLAVIVNQSVRQTLTRSINTVLTVIFVLVSLLVFGGGTVKYFILAMLIGVSSGMYSSIFTASPLWYDLRKVKKA